MSLKTAISSWPFFDAVRSRNGVPPLTSQAIHSEKCSSSYRTGTLKKLWIIIHDLDPKRLRSMKTHIENDFLHTAKARQIDIVSLKAALVIERDTRHGERELMAERLIRGLANVVAAQEACRIVLLGCGDAAWTLELALSGGSMKSNSISERVKDVLSNTVGIIFAPLSASLDRSFGYMSSKFDLVLEKDVFQCGKPMVERLDFGSTGPGESTLDEPLRITSDVLALVISSFERNEPLQAPQRAKTHPPRKIPATFPFKRAATAPSEFSPNWESGTTHTNVRSCVYPERTNQVSAMSAITEEPQVEDQRVTPRPTAYSSRASPIPLPKDERSHSTMEEERIAGVYFERWNLQSALHWYRKARQRLSHEMSQHRHYNIEISIASTLIRLGHFEQASRVLDGMSMATDKALSLNLRSVLAQCRSLCCTSSEEWREVTERLDAINKSYMAIPKRGPCEATQMILNMGYLASLRLLLGDNRNAETSASYAVREWKSLLKTQKLELDSLKDQRGNLPSAEQQLPLEELRHQYRQNEGDSPPLKPTPNIVSKANESLDRDAGKGTGHLEDHIENTTKNLLESEFRLVKIHTEVGRIDEAFEKNEDVLHHLRAAWGPNHVVTLRASNFHSKLLLLKEDYGEAEVTCKNSLRCMADHLGPEHYITLDFIGTLVRIYITQGRWKEVHEISETLVVRNRSAIGETHPQTIESEVDLAYLLELVGNTVTAEKFQRSVHEKCERILGKHHPTTLISRSRLASVYFSAGRFSDAALQVRAVSRYLDPERPAGDDHRSLSIATVRRTIGSVARRLASKFKAEANSKRDHGSQDEARNLAKEFFKISEDCLGEAIKFLGGALGRDHADVLSGRFEQYLIKRDKEEKVDEKLLKVLHDILISRQSRCGDSHPEIAMMQHELSLSYASIGGWEDARRLESASLEARLQAFETSHPDVLRSRLQLAPILWCVGQMKEAVKQLTRAHNTISQRPSNFPGFDLLSIKRNLANILVEIGEYKKAAELQRQLVSVSKDKNNYLATRNDLAFIYQKLGLRDDAEREYSEIEKELDNRCSDTSSKLEDPFVMIVKSNRASLHMEKAEYASAEKLQREVKRILKAHPAYGELNRDTITSRYNLALILKKQGEDKKAEKQLQKALQNMEKLAGKDHVESKEMDAKLREWTKSFSERKPESQVSKARSYGQRRDSVCAASD